MSSISTESCLFWILLRLPELVENVFFNHMSDFRHQFIYFSLPWMAWRWNKIHLNKKRNDRHKNVGGMKFGSGNYKYSLKIAFCSLQVKIFHHRYSIILCQLNYRNKKARLKYIYLIHSLSSHIRCKFVKNIIAL